MPIYDPTLDSEFRVKFQENEKENEKEILKFIFLIMKYPLSIQCHFILNFIMFGVSQIITFLVWKTSLIKSEFMFVWQLDTKRNVEIFF